MRWFPVLNDAFLNAQQWLDAETGFRTINKHNALYEFIIDTPAPGQSNQHVKGHDHQSSGVSGYQGGRAFGRNTCDVADGGDGELFKATPPTAGAWVKADLDWPSAYDRAPAGLAHLYPYITPGLVTPAGSPPSPPYLTALLWVSWTPVAGTPTVTFRLLNKTLSRYSEEVAQVSDPTPAYNNFLLVVDKLPCQGGRNEIDLELKADVTGLEVQIERCLIVEVCNDGAVTTTGGAIALK
jgi:hypothetical protein